MAFSSLLVDIRDRLRPLRNLMFPQLVLMEIRESGIQGHLLRNNQPLPLSLKAPLPALTYRDGLPLEKDSLGDLVGDLLVFEKSLEAYVMVVLPFEASHWRVLSNPFPETPDDPIETLRRLDPPLNLPFSLQDAYFDILPLAGRTDQQLLVASARGVVDGWVDVFRLAGVKLERMAPAQGCLFTALSDELFDSQDDELVAMLYPGEDSCMLWFFHQGIPVFEQRLPPEYPSLRDKLRQCLAFYHRQEPGLRQLRWLQSQPLDEQDRLEAELGVVAEILSPAPYGSLLLQGLAIGGDP